MIEFALLFNGQFKEIRRYSEKPVDIPHKSVTWLAVLREFGTPFEGVENGKWVIRTVDPATLPLPIPDSITSLQFRREVRARNKVTQFKTWLSTASEEVQEYFQFTDIVMKNDPAFVEFVALIGLSPNQVNQFFLAASAR